MSDFLELLRALTNPAKPLEMTDAQVDALIVGHVVEENVAGWPQDTDPTARP